MNECKLCSAEATDDLLCAACEGRRMAAASIARILDGTGLTYRNVEEFSQENYIKMRRKGNR